MDPAQRVPVGRTAVQVTRLGLGGGPLAGLFTPVSDEGAENTVHRAYAGGIRFYDTAPQYGSGLAEERLGRALAAYPRESYTLATKVGRLLRPLPEDGSAREGLGDYETTDSYPAAPRRAHVWDFSADGVRRSLEESFQRLGVERADIVHIHDPETHMDEAISTTFPALARMREQGMIGAVGVGLDFAWIGTRFARETDIDCMVVAGRYTLLDQSALPELLPLCVQRGIAVLAAGVLNSGILANPVEGATYHYSRADRATLDRARAVQQICERHGIPLGAAALQFPLTHSAVCSVIIGARSAHEMEENLRLFATEIPQDLWRELKAEGWLPEEAPLPGG